MSEKYLTKCSVCGQDILFSPGQNIAVCRYCDRPNERPKSLPEETSLMKYANERRNMGEFAEAEVAYRKVLQRCTEEHEARWGLLLCKYGVMYVEDDAQKERIITCRRARNSSFRGEPDFDLVMTQAAPDVQACYARDAEYIDKIQAQIRLVRDKIRPYDVFLCYKETAPEGGKTEDSHIAHDIYNDLTHSGYRVFFAPESLKEKAGANYEAAIFLAIELSSVMLVLGTKKEYFTGTWVRSEWKRFLERQDLGDDKLLIPLFRQAEDLPKEFKNRFIQGYKLEGLYMQDVKSRLNQVLKRENARLTLAMTFIRGQQFALAAQRLDLLLEEEPENPYIWLARAMAEEQICEERDFSQATHPLAENFYFQRALEYSKGVMKERLEGYQQTSSHSAGTPSSTSVDLPPSAEPTVRENIDLPGTAPSVQQEAELKQETGQTVIVDEEKETGKRTVTRTDTSSENGKLIFWGIFIIVIILGFYSGTFSKIYSQLVKRKTEDSIPSCEIVVTYKSDQGDILYRKYESHSPGTYTINRGNWTNYLDKDGWTPTGESSYRVTIYDDGSVSQSEVVFLFTSRKNSTGTVATITSKLYLRSGPGKPPSDSGLGNNDIGMYNCPGSKVTLVARAKHISDRSSGEYTWWFKLQGSIYEIDEKKTKDVTDYWTSYKYLDANSFDLESIPIVSGYFD